MAARANQFEERPAHLWLLAASPAIWAAHFVLSYATASIWCAKVASRSGSLGGARVAIGLYTVAALVAIVAVGVDAYRRHAHGSASLPHDADLPEDRYRFLGFAAVLLSGLSVIAVVYAALVAVFIGSCR